MEHYHFNQWRSAIQVYHLQKLAVFRCSRSDTFYFILSCTREDVRATSTYLIFLPSSNDVIFLLSKNNTHLSFPSIIQWCQLISFQNHQATMPFIFLLKIIHVFLFSFHKQWCQLLSFQKKKWRELWVNICAKKSIYVY